MTPKLVAMAVTASLLVAPALSDAHRRSVAVLHYGGSSSPKYADLKDALRGAITRLVSDLRDDRDIRSQEWVSCEPDFASENVEPTPIPADFWKSHNTVLTVLFGEIVGDVANTEIYVGDLVGEQIQPNKRRISMWLPVSREYLNDTKHAFAALTLFAMAMNASAGGDKVTAYRILVHANAELPRIGHLEPKPPKEFEEDFALLKKAIEVQIRRHQGPSTVAVGGP